MSSTKGNMSTGNPAKILIFFAIPMIVGNLFQQFYNIADSIIVGNFVSSKALAAVGASNAITNLFVMVAIGTGIGCSVVISQQFGAGKIEDVKSSISTALISILGLSIVLSILGYFMSGQLLKWMRTPDNVFEESKIYLQIYFLGFVFLFMYNAFNSVFNALGDSKKPLIFLIVSSVINVGLDLVFVAKLDMGVAGAAWATLIAQGVSAVVSFVVLMDKLRKMESGKYSRYDTGLLRKMVSMAIPSVIQQSIISIGLLLIQSAVNGFGDEFMAGYTAAIKIDSIVIVPMVNVGNAVSTFVAQNMGAGLVERSKKGYRIGLVMAAGLGVVLGLILNLTAEGTVGLFMDSKESANAIKTGADYLRITSYAYFIMGMMNVTSAVLRGAGDKIWFLIQSLVNLAVRVILVYALAELTEGMVVMWASGVGWTIGFLISFCRYRQGGWQKAGM